MSWHVRDATEVDLPAITELFNAPIRATTTTWRDHPADHAEMAEWFDERRRGGDPVLVAELDGRVVGYTCWAAFRGGPRFPGYATTVEQTVHVADGLHGRGIGRGLVEALVDRAHASGVHVLVAGVDSENTASCGFHRALGYEEVARMPEVGRKFDRWLDLVLLQRILR
jgi:phosphinothricin acetyltransferase